MCCYDIIAILLRNTLFGKVAMETNNNGLHFVFFEKI